MQNYVQQMFEVAYEAYPDCQGSIFLLALSAFNRLTDDIDGLYKIKNELQCFLAGAEFSLRDEPNKFGDCQTQIQRIFSNAVNEVKAKEKINLDSEFKPMSQLKKADFIILKAPDGKEFKAICNTEDDGSISFLSCEKRLNSRDFRVETPIAGRFSYSWRPVTAADLEAQP